MVIVTAAEPPPGQTYDFDYSKRYLYRANVAIISAGLTLSTSFLAVRVFTKARLLHKFGWDDVSIILAWLFALGTQACSLYGYRHGGMGLHLWNLPPEVYESYIKVVFTAAIIYVPALALAKISLIILYYRILCQEHYQRWTLYALAFIVSSYSIALIFAFIFGCQPVHKAWSLSVTGSCIDQYALYVATAVMNIITDIALIIVPVPTVIGLNMPTVQKIGLLFMFMVGCATLVTGIIRLITLIPFLNSSDPTHAIGWPDLWINIEANFIIICPCLPFLRHLLRRYAPRWIGEHSSLARRYMQNYAYNYTRESTRGRRKEGLTQLQDEIELAENLGSVHSGVRIVKEIQWEITTEETDAHEPGPEKVMKRHSTISGGV
ncbi:uncharacterized protein BO97DRAFT_378986 [Aspergillus homomorphus CBS 101889]|uniref:Rhodopsin domain-containing protein n=1 Tax=Aspergillus homomorphus (strain CBS 101889) TaxID=1450537 RepID=A0A395HJ77_ASPHC|nr:hypothetical protein BO97DRAFT_378986 [Aspergillus homomorphus CBS 101889]RAL07235.1 hypothetical protein BO97DRAFT_378986 [Aspergillus homomorphus CBS 101889]